jgi:monoterpene epsilon-lactone hydrolase
MPSLTARLFQSLLGAASSGRLPTSEAQLLAGARQGDAALAPRVGRHLAVEAREAGGHHVFTIRSRNRPVRAHILYLHGGGYVNGPAFLHWWFIARLARMFDASCTVPRYPLAPAFGCDEAIAFVSAVYRELAARVGARNIVVMGDSAGGGLALAMLQHTGLRPAGLFLNALWLDASVSDPSQPDLERGDWLLSRFVLRTWGQSWARSRDLSDPVVSPLFGDLSILRERSSFAARRISSWRTPAVWRRWRRTRSTTSRNLA